MAKVTRAAIDEFLRAIYRAEENGIRLITGFCMFMFLPRTGLVHRFHGGVMRLVGAYPR